MLHSHVHDTLPTAIWDETSSHTPSDIPREQIVVLGDNLIELYAFGSRITFASITDDVWNVSALELVTVPSIDQLRQIVSSAFQGIPEINSIFMEQDQNEIVIKTLLSNVEYDDTLMDMLLDRELEVRDTLPSLTLDFHYIPLLGKNSDELISASAKEIFKVSD